METVGTGGAGMNLGVQLSLHQLNCSAGALMGSDKWVKFITNVSRIEPKGFNFSLLITMSLLTVHSAHFLLYHLIIRAASKLQV